uniref:Uncharacterized protein n=1 Tax=Haptolina brevifila TaxID=156173 RepID=A0A7S2JI10_9EUKA|mmetsp:Transcript_82957/g.165603  ORF Transcript_82957/g.165603 Transcript_82957/m.165603 type:complete len:574 (+) Transcript_82957:153-1874(+)
MAQNRSKRLGPGATGLSGEMIESRTRSCWIEHGSDVDGTSGTNAELASDQDIFARAASRLFVDGSQLAWSFTDFPVGGFAYVPTSSGNRRIICRVLGHDLALPGIRVQPERDMNESVVPLSRRGLEPADKPGAKWEVREQNAKLRELIKKGNVTELREAIKHLDPFLHKRVLTAKCFVSSQRTTLLHIAAGHIVDTVAEITQDEVLRVVLDALGDDVPLHTLTDHKHQTAIFDAAFDLRRSALSMMLHHSQKDTGLVNSRDTYGQTCLHAVVKKAAASLKDVDRESIIAFTDMAWLLLQRGCDAALADNSGWNAVHHCIPEEGGSKGAPLQPSSVLMIASVCEMLIEAGCPVDDPDDSGATALFWAVAYGKDELAPLIQTLCRHGADPRKPVGEQVLKDLAKTNIDWRTPLDAVMSMSSDPNFRVQCLLSILLCDEEQRRRLSRPSGLFEASGGPPRGDSGGATSTVEGPGSRVGRGPGSRVGRTKGSGDRRSDPGSGSGAAEARVQGTGASSSSAALTVSVGGRAGKRKMVQMMAEPPSSLLRQAGGKRMGTAVVDEYDHMDAEAGSAHSYT